ncbi:hypothetical protein [Streptomyces sp. NPDC046197]|uniref:hypothetical protein n=1 Tax=Streptomyces sp. NPDC046197 TaxID=3154337 RepID=UPI0033D1F106
MIEPSEGRRRHHRGDERDDARHREQRGRDDAGSSVLKGISRIAELPVPVISTRWSV